MDSGKDLVLGLWFGYCNNTKSFDRWLTRGQHWGEV